MKKTDRHQSIAYQNSERGQSLVELALTFTILVILLGGVLDLGRAFFTFVALRDAAQEGAVYGSIHSTDLAGIRNRVIYSSGDGAESSGVINLPLLDSQGELDIVIDIPTPCLGNPIQVDVTYSEFELVMPFLGAIIGSQTIPIHATVTDTILRPSCGP